MALLGLIAIALSDFVWLAAALLLVVVIIVLNRDYLERRINEMKKRDSILIMISERLGLISDKIEALSSEIRGNALLLDSRIDAARSEIVSGYRQEIESSYSSLAGRIIEIENRLSSFRKTFSSALGSMDERLLQDELKEDERSRESFG